MQGRYHSFTTAYSSVIRRLTNHCRVLAFGKEKEALALWDTGATTTCISEEVVASMALVPTGQTQIRTPSGATTVNTYLVDIVLPNKVTVKDVMVCDSKIGDQGIGLLIGMDIISAGEMYISSFGSRTTFSFRIPAKKAQNFAKEDNVSALIGETHGRGKRKKR